MAGVVSFPAFYLSGPLFKSHLRPGAILDLVFIPYIIHLGVSNTLYTFFKNQQLFEKNRKPASLTVVVHHCFLTPKDKKSKTTS